MQFLCMCIKIGKLMAKLPTKLIRTGTGPTYYALFSTRCHPCLRFLFSVKLLACSPPSCSGRSTAGYLDLFNKLCWRVMWMRWWGLQEGGEVGLAEPSWRNSGEHMSRKQSRTMLETWHTHKTWSNSTILSHLIGCNDLVLKRWRKQVDKGRGWPDPSQVCHSSAAAAMPTDTHRRSRWERKDKRQEMETQPGCNGSTMTVPSPQMSRKQSRMAMEISVEGKKGHEQKGKNTK